MPIGSINRKPTQTAESQQTTGTAKTGAYNDKVVSTKSEGSVDSPGKVGSNIPKNDMHTRSMRRPTSGERQGLFGRLKSRLSGRRQSSREISSPSAATTDATSSIGKESMQLMQGYSAALIDIAKNGIAATKENIVSGLADAKTSEEVNAFLESGDKGVRRGVTGIHNLAEAISFTNLSAKEKSQLPANSLERLGQQSMQIKGMGQMVAGATFLEGRRDFNHVGTPGINAYSEMLEKYPQHDTAMRTWIRDGINLGSDLIDAQERVLVNGQPLSEDAINALQRRADDFANKDLHSGLGQDPFAPVDRSESKIEGFTDEVLTEASKKIKKETTV